MEATLQVTSRPTGATIWLNEQMQTRKTPSTFTLQPGEYIIAVHSPGHVREETRLLIEANQQQSINLVMKPGEVPAGMVLVPAGEFSMGADDRAPEEVPLRKIDLPAFYIDKFEVTNLEFKQVFPRHTYPEGQDSFPVTGVTWNQAQEYARAVRKRLPTEAEWEKAARGEAGLEYPWGADFDPGRCNSEEGGKGATTRVGSYIRGGSPYGCMDMAGNVYEWVQDLYGPYGQIFRVLRGGSYKTDRFDVRGAARHFDKPDAKKPDYGFRCAMDVK
jgi:formylglycine-generating enzyme required for sulfatase activity